MPSNQRTVTEKRRAANRAAAQKSTGPKTPEGKQRAALAEEKELFRRRQELDIEQPEDGGWPGLHPLGETWQRTVLGIERLDRQINAKVRLLLRLQEHAEKTGSAELSSNSAAFLTGEGTHASNDSSPLPVGEGGERGSSACRREPGERGSADLLFKSAAFDRAKITSRGVTKQLRATLLIRPFCRMPTGTFYLAAIGTYHFAATFTCNLLDNGLIAVYAHYALFPTALLTWAGGFVRWAHNNVGRRHPIPAMALSKSLSGRQRGPLWYMTATDLH